MRRNKNAKIGSRSFLAMCDAAPRDDNRAGLLLDARFYRVLTMRCRCGGDGVYGWRANVRRTAPLSVLATAGCRDLRRPSAKAQDALELSRQDLRRETGVRRGH